MDLPPEAVALLALPPARFTAERDALAAALMGRGHPAAPDVRKLRRPVGLAWVLNRLARERPRDVATLLAAGDRLRAAQRRAASGGGGAAFRDAEAALRERARALRLAAEPLLAAEGRPAAATILARLELLLRVAATGADREPLREGRLAREPALGAGELSGFTLLAGGPGAATASATDGAPSEGGRTGGTQADGGAPRGARTAAGARAARELREVKARERDEERARQERRRVVARARAEAARAERRAVAEAKRAEAAERLAREARERAAEARALADRLASRALTLERG